MTHDAAHSFNVSRMIRNPPTDQQPRNVAYESDDDGDKPTGESEREREKNNEQ